MKKNKNLWLIGGHNGQLYTDNAKVFHAYLLQHHPEIELYWVINKNAPAFSMVQGDKIIKGSIKSYLYFYRAEVALFSDTLNSDIAPFSFLLPIVKHFYDKTFKVYLSHGTIAFKKMPSFSGRVAKLKHDVFASYDLAIASSVLSKKAMIGYGIGSSNIVIAGNARNDALEAKPTTRRSILIAPTWRPNLQEKAAFKENDFYQQYSTLLTDTKLLRYLEKEEIYIDFYLHHMFHCHHDYFQTLQSSYVHILPPEAEISQVIASAEMMVTDYSSICADFYYLRKPVLFFQFDQKTFSASPGSEIDLENDTFGDVYFEVDILIKALIDTLESKQYSDKQKAGEKYFIHFRDKQNSERIYHAIQERLPCNL